MRGRIDNQYGKKAKPSKSKRKGQNKNNYCENDREVINVDEQQPEVVLDVFGKMSVKTSQALLLITPNHQIMYHQTHQKLIDLQKKYNREKALLLIQENYLKDYQIKNIQILKSMEDDDFWYITMQQLTRLLIEKLPELNLIKLMLAQSSQIVDISRENILILLACMFMGIMPQQPHERSVNMGNLMAFNEKQSQSVEVRRQKMKCIISYFKIMIKNHKIWHQFVRIKRTSNTDKKYLDVKSIYHEVPLRQVIFQSSNQRNIEDFYGEAIMVDFASKHFGGGILQNDCYQEEILFSIFPELIISKLLCHQLQDDEAVIFYSARRFSNYRGYANNFQFSRLKSLQHKKKVQKSVIVAIDAQDYRKNSEILSQYSRKSIRRQINKAFAGFEGATFEGDQDMPICTGPWGCQKLKGAQDLKFLIQWIASSEANRQMIYITSDQKIKQYKQLTAELSDLTTLDLLNILDQYVSRRPKERMELLQYIKYNV